ncbi:haloalkane dehalogenase [Shimia isoporae]|uniref:Haloalkane dehalogenase n=1 Tax=Shimia isoporae TaxID=647720 RepID=A0A4R1N2B8_9RHOB|nr:haloalkane dehalogenase [Shimia isoporae]TCL00530.1 haloalkane dehalogenase [Shimia isoporae]
MDFLRTPDDRFDNLPDYNFAPHYKTVDDTEGGQLRVHYLDEGPDDAAPILVMHGEPSWCYLYRHMIPLFSAAGHRVVAPDLVGFGRSDKPTKRTDYTYQRHVDWMTDWLQQVDLTNITLVCQDWGGLIGLRLVAAMPERFARIVVANTALPTGDQPMGKAFEGWREFSQTTPVFNTGKIIYGGTTSKLTEAEIAAYDAPFPDETYKEGARQFPMLVPASPDDPAAQPNRDAWKVLMGLDIPVLTAFGSDDKIMAGVDKVFQKLMPGAAGQPHTILEGGNHFLQEDVAPELSKATLDFIERT